MSRFVSKFSERLNPMKILIVDDSRAMRMIVSRALRQAELGTDIIEASCGPDALKLLQSAQPDLVLCDWNMPEMSGLELLEQLKGQGITVKFGFVTSESTPAMRTKATDAGALFLISKPFTSEAFAEQLRPVLAS
jgi:two-component system chemotaxis response regulator CheY